MQGVQGNGSWRLLTNFGHGVLEVERKLYEGAAYFIFYAVYKLSRCASCDLCAYFRNPQGQAISSWILAYLCACPTISTALKVFGPKKILVYVIGISQILI
jgi:hypothetical protein